MKKYLSIFLLFLFVWALKAEMFYLRDNTKLPLSGGNVGSPFSVGVSTFVVKGGKIGLGTSDFSSYHLRNSLGMSAFDKHLHILGNDTDSQHIKFFSNDGVPASGQWSSINHIGNSAGTCYLNFDNSGSRFNFDGKVTASSMVAIGSITAATLHGNGDNIILSTYAPLGDNYVASKRYVDDIVGGSSFEYYLREAASGLDNYRIMLSSPSNIAKSTITVNANALNVFVSSWVTASDEPTFNTLQPGVHRLALRVNLGADRDVRLKWKMLYITTDSVIVPIDESAELPITEGIDEALYYIPIVLSTPVDLPTGARLIVALYVSNYGSATDFNVYIQDETASRVEFRTNIGSFDNRYAMKYELTSETDRAIARENDIAVSTGTNYADIQTRMKKVADSDLTMGDYLISASSINASGRIVLPDSNSSYLVGDTNNKIKFYDSWLSFYDSSTLGDWYIGTAGQDNALFRIISDNAVEMDIFNSGGGNQIDLHTNKDIINVGNIVMNGSINTPEVKTSTITFGDGSSQNTSLGIGAKGDLITFRVPIWHGGETTTTSASFVTKTFKCLMLGSTIYDYSGSTRDMFFEVIGSSVVVELYNHTTGGSVAGSTIQIDDSYSTVPDAIANCKSVAIPAASFSDVKNMYSLRMKSFTGGTTAKVAEAVILMRYRKQ